jgi:small subunit ribosomal protein S6
MALETAPQRVRSKEYETIYVLRSDVDPDTAEKVQQRVSEVVDREAGKLVKVEAWGRRKLAYPVRKNRKGVYVYVKYVGKGGLVAELERNLKLQDAVIKFQTVLVQEDVDVAGIAVGPEEIKFQRLELPPEEEEKESRERALGLVDFGGEGPRSMKPRDVEEEFEAEDIEPEAAEAKKDGESEAEEG